MRAIERLLDAAMYDSIAFDSFELAHEYIDLNEVSLVIVDLYASSIAGHYDSSPADDDSGESLRRLNWAREALLFCKRMREDRATTELPVIILSKSHRPRDKVACLNAGASDYIGKPYQRTELLSRVKAHLRSRRYERELTEKFEQLNVLHAVSSVLASSLDPETMMSGTLSVLVENLDANAGVVYLRDPDTRSMKVVASEGFSTEEESLMGLLDLYSRTAPLMNGKPVVLDPVPESVRVELAGDVLREIHSLVCAPLRLKGSAAGAICLFSRTREPLPKQQAELLATIANQLSVALENARLYVETKKSAAQLSFVYNLSNNLMTSLEMDELLGYAVFAVGKALECDACAVVVKTASESNNLASAIYGHSNEERYKERNLYGYTDWYHEDRVMRYLNTGFSLQPAIEMRVSDRLLRDPEISVETIVPLIFDDMLLGMLICASWRAQPISADDQKLLGAVAQQLSLAIRNTEVYQSTKDTSINLAVEVGRRTREIEEQKRFTEKIIDSLPVSLYVVDRDLRIVAWNRNREVGGRGINREEVLGRNVFQVLTRQPRRKLEGEFTDVFRSGDMVRMEQESFVDGHKKVWKISKIPMRVDNAEVTHVITVGEDVTEQKKMNEAVIHAEKLASIGRLAAGVVHELNNPLATIAACSEALTARVGEIADEELNQDFSEYLHIIRDEAFRCKTITNNLLDFSHQRQAEKLPSDINQVIEQTLQLLKHHPKLGKMQVIKELDLSLTPVYVNEGQMKQVFIALVSNAFDAMEGDGSLTIRTCWSDSSEERTVSVEFIDTGCGIPASHLQKIFDPFFTTKPLGRGTGLGLSVCYGIVSEHGGKMEVDSTEGKETTFRVLLPLSSQVPAHGAADMLEEEVMMMEGVL
ncbi:MAG: ATP-binding protein [Blastocatellia bacterium]|nr:ATP-binding protein [Blastocatellia bacterium]